MTDASRIMQGHLDRARKRVEELENRVAELEQELDICKGFHKLAVAERDLERVRRDRLSAKLDAVEHGRRVSAAYRRLIAAARKVVANNGAEVQLLDALQHAVDAADEDYDKRASGEPGST